ncbi:hypothetical protein ACFWM1_32605 [Nocardia sp. NPDC058379]|uniref:hypothetical protein n=1 Tax=unclassified Nocardia TaxID=2637762 RepID=UPI00364C82ED
MRAMKDATIADAHTVMRRAVTDTGSSRGIGRATAGQLAAKGALVAVHYAGNEAAARETRRWNCCRPREPVPRCWPPARPRSAGRNAVSCLLGSSAVQDGPARKGVR